MNLLQNKRENSEVWLKSLAISLLIHAILGVWGYFLIEKSEILSHKKESEKVRLSFKRGGDSAIKDSKYKENTSIPSSAMRELQQIAQDSAHNAQDSAKSTPQILKLPQDSSTQDSRKIDGTKSVDLSPALSNLQIYDNVSINPNLHEMKYRQALAYIASRPIPSDIKNEVIDLYGDELGDYGLAEIDFIVNNLRDIGRITQYHINRRGYPREAALLGQSGKNVIEFYLHPNGDISDLRVVSSSNSIILDNDMQTNIKVAFKEYPRPTTKVKIRFFMSYTHTINPYR